jgi:hypothetical protein
MPYEAGGRLPGETGSKLSHLELVDSEWVKDLVKGFERLPAPTAGIRAQPRGSRSARG